ncbi:MBL fold metallo-hydrolase [Rummeliibacillus sp. POC4]|nr:MBL fold metallo-hydrolase [Rummeliibacillus sp. POC4]RIJ63825.1 MBL fold metallo-hydrolase [Rummeliibacillus sp. POC4]
MLKYEKIADHLYSIDTNDLGLKNRTTSYIIVDDKIALIETSASPSIPYILNALEELHIKPSDIDYLILTHIHLDHAGGAGVMMKYCPNATVLVHPKGVRHLVDPIRLIASARSVYGENFDAIFGEILPIQEKQLYAIGDREIIRLGSSTLTFYYTKGHANHHISIHESLTNGMFVGDTTGVYYPDMTEEEFDVILPSTSPNQFDPNLMEDSIQLFEKIKPNVLYFGHYGPYPHPEFAYAEVRRYLPIFMDAGRQAMKEETDFKKQVHRTEEILTNSIFAELQAKGLSKDHPVFKIIPLDLAVSAMGIIDYLSKSLNKPT